MLMQDLRGIMVNTAHVAEAALAQAHRDIHTVHDIDEHASTADVAVQFAMIQALARDLPQVPILAEEQQPETRAEIFKAFPMTQLLDAESKLPPSYLSIDPLDGSVLFVNHCEEFTASVGYIEGGTPIAGAVVAPMRQFCLGVERGKGCAMFDRLNHPVAPFKLDHQKPMRRSIVGLDICKAVPEETIQRVVLPLVYAFRYLRNLPSVMSGIELLLGRTAAWVSTNAKNWDVAATALMVEEAGGIAECLNGDPIPWDRVTMPPLLFAAHRKIADEVRAVVKL